MHPVSPRLFDVRAQLATPEAFGLTDTVLVSIAQPGEVHLHGWFVKATPPSGGRAADIMVYLHGNMGDRALEHRVRLYKLLRSHLQVRLRLARPSQAQRDNRDRPTPDSYPSPYPLPR